MRPVVAGMLAGFAATVPMTAAMVWLHRRLPHHERYPLPPHQITQEVAEKAGIALALDEGETRGRALANHFAYGAAAGAIYGPLEAHISAPPLVKGACFGLLVWTGSYLGWLPAAEILTPATQHPPRRNALMIAAHIVWGGALGRLVERATE